MLSFFPLDVLDEIWDLIESVSEGFLIYSYEKRLIYCVIAEVAHVNYSQERILISQSHDDEPSSTFVRLNYTENVCFNCIFFFTISADVSS